MNYPFKSKGVNLMKRTIALILTAVLLLSVSSALSGCGAQGDRVVIYTAAEEERIAYLNEALQKQFPGTEIVFQSLGTGQLLAKLLAEGKNTGCDIFYDLEVVNAEIILESAPELFADLSGCDFSVYDESVMGYGHKKYAVNGKTDGALLVNTALLQEKGLPVPKTYDDLLNPAYRGLIAIPSPKSSGTGYSLYNGIVTMLGAEEGSAYFDKLNANIKEYTTSGSAPVKSVVRGDAAIGFGLLWQCVAYAGENPGMQVVIPDNKAPFGLFTMGIISGHETRQAVKDVFDYLFNTLNRTQVVRFNPDRIYTEQGKPEIPGYPEGFEEIAMSHLFDNKYKQDLLDKWKF